MHILLPGGYLQPGVGQRETVKLVPSGLSSLWEDCSWLLGLILKLQLLTYPVGFCFSGKNWTLQSAAFALSSEEIVMINPHELIKNYFFVYYNFVGLVDAILVGFQSKVFWRLIP